MAFETNALLESQSTTDESSNEICPSREPISTITYHISIVDAINPMVKAINTREEWRPRYKGNLGEIVFAEYCEQEYSDSEWTWLNETVIKETYENEYNCVDFTVCGQCVDVKTRTQTTSFERLCDDIGEDSRSQTDVIVGVFLDPDERLATILGWLSYDELAMSAPSREDKSSNNSKIDLADFRGISTLDR